MTGHQVPPLESASVAFAAADASLLRGDFAEFMRTVIAAREVLKALHWAGSADLPVDTLSLWRRLNTEFEVLFEWQSGLNLLDSHDTPVIDASGPNFAGAKADTELLRQLGLLGVGELVFVGSGAFPQTLLYLHQSTPIVRLRGLDRDVGRTYFAKRLIRACKLDDRVCLAAAEGVLWDYGSADVVIVASLVEDKDAVVARIAATASDGAVVLLRVPTGWGQLLYEGTAIDPTTWGRLHHLRTVRPSANPLFQTHVLRVGNSPFSNLGNSP